MSIKDHLEFSRTQQNGRSAERGALPGPLVSCYAYCGGYRWHWWQTHDSFPGQPVALVHCPLMPSPSLLPLAEAISRWAPVFLPDLPGYGLSSGADRSLSIAEFAAALAEWLPMAGASPAHLVGVSFGSQIAADLAQHFPRRLRSLTLVGPTIDPSARHLRTQLARWATDISEEPRWLWLEYLRSHSPERLRHTLGAIRAVAKDRIETKLPDVTVPTLVLRGATDPLAPEEWTNRAAQLAPEGAAQTLPLGAHGVYSTHPGIVSKAIRKFTFPLRNRERQGDASTGSR